MQLRQNIQHLPHFAGILEFDDHQSLSIFDFKDKVQAADEANNNTGSIVLNQSSVAKRIVDKVTAVSSNSGRASKEAFYINAKHPWSCKNCGLNRNIILDVHQF